MGTWAEGNFENDGALDYVGDLIDQLTKSIEDCFGTDSAALDESGESELMPSVAIIKLLCAHAGAAPPKADVVRRWRSMYLAIFDDQIENLDPKADFKERRRKVIDETFTELITIATKFWTR